MLEPIQLAYLTDLTGVTFRTDTAPIVPPPTEEPPQVVVEQRAPIIELPENTEKARGAIDKSGAGKYDDVEVLNEKILAALQKCPALSKHFGDILGAPKGAAVVFSATAKDAFYSKTGDRAKGVPDNVIILPSKGKTPLDLLDGLIFETCNAEIQQDYDDLNKDLFARLRAPTPEKPPLTLLDYGKQKAEIESKAVLKDAQLLFAAAESDVEIAYQGQRNLLAMLKVCKETGGGTLDDFDTILEDPVALKKCLDDHKEELGKFLGDADTDEDIRKAILSAMASSPHNRNAGEGDKNSLNSDDLYAYELLETMTAPQIITMILTEIGKTVQLTTEVQKALRPLIQSRIGAFDVMGGEAVDRSARNAVVFEIIDDLKEMIPALAEATFPSFGSSPAMANMAKLRQAKCKEANGEVFGEGAEKEKALKLQMKSLLG